MGLNLAWTYRPALLAKRLSSIDLCTRYWSVPFSLTLTEIDAHTIKGLSYSSSLSVGLRAHTSLIFIWWFTVKKSSHNSGSFSLMEKTKAVCGLVLRAVWGGLWDLQHPPFNRALAPPTSKQSHHFFQNNFKVFYSATNNTTIFVHQDTNGPYWSL